MREYALQQVKEIKEGIATAVSNVRREIRKFYLTCSQVSGF